MLLLELDRLAVKLRPTVVSGGLLTVHLRRRWGARGVRGPVRLSLHLEGVPFTFSSAIHALPLAGTFLIVAFLVDPGLTFAFDDQKTNLTGTLEPT